MRLPRVDRPMVSPVPRDLLDAAQTLTGALQTVVDRFPEYRCLTVLDGRGDEQHLPLGQLWERARRVQVTLAARGLQPGEAVVLILPTGPELLAAYFGVMLAGGVPGLVATPSNRIADFRIYGRHVGAILANAAAHILYCSPDVAALFRDHPEVLGATRLLTREDVDAAADPIEPVCVRPDDIATIQYSSGSTGRPRGVLLSHAAILDNVRAIRAGLALRPDDVTVNWIPLYHDMGLIDSFLLPLLCGCSTVLIPTMDFMADPSLWLWAIHRYGGALSWAPNFAYNLCATRIPDRDIEGLDLSTWRLAVSASEPILASTVRAFAERFAPYGFRATSLTPFYGLAENVTAVTGHPPDEEPRIETIDRALLASENVARPVEGGGLESVSCGIALPSYELEIRGNDGRALPERHVGTIFVRTKALCSGYRDDPEATQRALVDGWLDTEDRGYLADGHLYFVAREKDLIVIGGEKYVPHDIEALLNEVDGVRAGCAVAFGVLNHERGTEEIAAVIETHETGEERRAEIQRAVRRAVLSTLGQALRHVLLVPPGGVEKTTSGKLARSATRQRYADHVQ